jgi:predicted nucleic acid-binding protein
VKVLFDSNVLVSSAIYGGAASRAIRGTLEARWKVFTCATVLAETRRVIVDKFGRGQGLARSAVQTFRDVFEIAEEPLTKHRVPGDEDDTPILRAAVWAGVDYLVTRDAKILALNPVEGVRIISLTDYLRILQSHGFARD